MRKSFLLFKLKVLEYFSSIRRTKHAFVALVLTLYGVIMFGLTMGNLTREYLEEVHELYNYTKNIHHDIYTSELYYRINYLESFVSLILGIAFLITIIVSIRTAFTATESDRDFIFSSPITFKEYAFAEILYQTLLDNIIFSVFTAYLLMVTNISTVGIGIWNVPIAILLFETFLLTMTIFGQILSILYLKNKRITGILISILIIITSLPIINNRLITLPFDPRLLPYPPYILGRVIFGRYEVYDVIYFLLYPLIGFIIWNKIINQNYFVEVEPVTIGVFGGISERRIRPTLGIKYGWIRKLFTVDISGSILKIHITKEFTRVLRDGSLIEAIGINIIYSVILYFVFLNLNITENTQSGFSYGFPISMALFFTLFAPFICIEKWRITERKYLWVILSSYADVDEYVKGLLISSMIISIIVPFGILIILAIYLPLSYLLLGIISVLTLAIIVTEFAYLLEFRYGKPTYETFSVDYLLIIMGAYIMSSLMISPNIIILWVSTIMTNIAIIQFIPIILIYNIIIVYVGYKLALREFKNIKVS